MPQTKPMTPELFAYRLQDFARGLDIPEFKNAAKAMAWYDNAQKSERDEWEKLINERDAQLIASTLQAAADRVCKICQKNCIFKNLGFRVDKAEYQCKKRKAILTPLDEKKGR